jgi:hypothetical protein
MNSIRHKANKLATTVCLLAVCSSLLIACGEGSDSSDQTAGIGGTGIVAGKITGFGSIHVNGGKFDIDTSTFLVDGESFVGQAGQDVLAVGMVVRIKVETENGTFSSIALDVVYDDEIEGPITNIILDPTDPSLKIGAIFGQMITFDATSTVFDADGNPGFNFASIGVSDVVEVSGFRASATEIAATYVRFVEDLNPGTTKVELRGQVKKLMGTPPNETFMIDGVVITTNIATKLEDGVLVEDLYVEVKGKIQNDLSVIADKIKSEDENFGDDVDEISLQGIVSMFNDISNFEIDGQAVDASSAQLKPAGLTLVDGLNIEVEGEIVGSKLIADEVELRDGDTKLRAPIVGTVNTINNSFQVTYPVATGPTTVVVNTNGQTLFEDETGALSSTPPFSLDDLVATDFVRIEGQELNGEVVASVVKRVDGGGQNLKLEGMVDTFVANSSITILGITYNVDPAPGTGTDFEDFASSADFFAALNPIGGDLVEIEDDDIADGVADEVELE